MLDNQAWLYANQLKLQAKVENPSTVITKSQFEAWENEWKITTAELVKEVEDGDEETSNPG